MKNWLILAQKSSFWKDLGYDFRDLSLQGVQDYHKRFPEIKEFVETSIIESTVTKFSFQIDHRISIAVDDCLFFRKYSRIIFKFLQRYIHWVTLKFCKDNFQFRWMEKSVSDNGASISLMTFQIKTGSNNAINAYWYVCKNDYL